MVKSQELAAQLKQHFALLTKSRNSWKVTMDDEERLRWSGSDGTGEVVLEREPYASVWRRIGAWVVRALPIEQQL